MIFSPQNQQLSRATYRDATLNCDATRDRVRGRGERERAKFALNSLEAINSYLVSRLNQININLRSQLETVAVEYATWQLGCGNCRWNRLSSGTRRGTG